MQSLYTEVLTREEWLQVMDHAFSNQPLWLWCFHVQWVIHLREQLLQLHDHQQLCAMFRKISPLNLNQLIQQAYRLQQRHIPSPLSEPTCVTRSVMARTVSVLECDEVAITQLRNCSESLNTNKKNSVKGVWSNQQATCPNSDAEDTFVSKQRSGGNKVQEARRWVRCSWNAAATLRDVEMRPADGLKSGCCARRSPTQLEVNAATQSARDAEIDRKRK